MVNIFYISCFVHVFLYVKQVPKHFIYIKTGVVLIYFVCVAAVLYTNIRFGSYAWNMFSWNIQHFFLYKNRYIADSLCNLASQFSLDTSQETRKCCYKCRLYTPRCFEVEITNNYVKIEANIAAQLTIHNPRELWWFQLLTHN